MSDPTRYAPPVGPAALRPLAVLIGAFDVAVAWLLCGLLSVMVAVVAAQVAMRYGFNNSIDWADEVSRLTFVWSIFLALPLGLRMGAHIGVEFVTTRLPTGLRRGIGRLVALVGCALLLLVAWEAVKMARDQWDELMASVEASAAWFIVPVAICGLHGALHLLWLALTGPLPAPATPLEDLG